MITLRVEHDFEVWSDLARRAASAGLGPDRIIFRDWDEASELFEDKAEHALPGTPSRQLAVPKDLIHRMRSAACHRHAERWNLMYRVLWRVAVEGDRGLLADSADEDVRDLETLVRQVRIDSHKAKAFVRFRKADTPNEKEHFIAWHKPDHRVLPLIAPFFAKRFSSMRWSIFTPDCSAHWDGDNLRLGPGVPNDPLESRDNLEELWKTYYASIFNPARIKIGAMLKEMPRRYWDTMPETSIIEELLANAPDRVRAMVDEGGAVGADAFLPPKGHRSLPQLRSAIRQCEGCDLHECATQPVFGEGPADAELVIVGEQPGDQEDRAGRPFVGPAGEVLDRALGIAGVRRETVYLTNAVKHFRYEQRGEHRMHRRPSLEQQRACHPWLEAEMAVLGPKLIVALGVTATQALLGRTVRMKDVRGRLTKVGRWPAPVLPTLHPASVLRAASTERQAQMFQALVDDLNHAVVSCAISEGA